ncbi:MAG TPA: hypothetical protein VLF59_04780 [Candidatus Saccharimonadales bacterium]|nr:hypothetical protein [Candidatus Saccharimonadales bacterium]
MIKAEIAANVEPVFQTLALRDADKVTIVVGSAAMAVHFAEADAPVPPFSDVDVLCSRDFFTRTCSQSANLLGMGEFRVRHSGTTPRTRMRSPVLDLYPSEDDRGTVPFSACEAMGGTWYPISYNDCASEERVEHHRGYRFLKMAELLVWTAASGREKDIRKIDTLLPTAFDCGLITDEEHARIVAERDVSARLRSEHPGRYYARVPGS